MKNFTKLKLITAFVMLLTLILGVSVFAEPEKFAVAESPTYTVTFKRSGENNSNAEIIKSITVNSGDSLLLKDIPKEGDEGLPIIENNKYIWFYVVDGKLIKATIPNDPNSAVIQNINSDIVFWAIKQDTSKKHTITFIMPDSTIVTKTVSDGETVDEPMVELGFCERAKYDKSLKNIKESMTINVSIDNTLKYVFMAGCGALLVASLTVIVLVIFKTLKMPDDDWDDDLVPVDGDNDDANINIDSEN